MVVTSHEYLPFGEDWITEGNTKNAPKYNSQELDKEMSPGMKKYIISGHEKYRT